MALERQTVQFTFGQGVDTKTSSQSVAAGKLLTLENGVFTSPQEIKKRPGHKALASLSVGQGIAGYKSELLGFDGKTLNSYDQATNTWVQKATLVSTHVSLASVARNVPYTQHHQDGATLGLGSNGLQVYTFTDSQQGGSSYTVIDEATGNAMVAARLISTHAIKAKVLALGGSSQLVLILWVNNSDHRLYGATVSALNPTAALSPVALTPAATNAALNSTAPNYDATVIGTKVFVAYNDSTPATGGITAFYSTTAAPLTVVSTVSVLAEPADVIAAIPDAHAGGPVVTWWNAGTGNLKFQAYNGTLASVLGTGTLENLSEVYSITGANTSAGSTALVFFYGTSSPGAQTYNYFTKTNTAPSYTPGTAATLLRSVAPAAKAFVLGGKAYLPVSYDSPAQPTYFVVDSSGTVVARFLSGIAGPSLSNQPVFINGGANLLPESSALQDGSSFRFPFLEVLPYFLGNTWGLDAVTLTFNDSTHSYGRSEIADNLHVSGGLLWMYDGTNVVEHGFHLWPEPVTVPAPAAGNTYQYAVTYEWTDHQGNIHRSAPSPGVQHQQANPIDGGHIANVTVPTLRVSAKSNVTIRLYRTVNNGTILYEAEVANNDPTVDTITIGDSLSDAALVSRTQLYTTGGVVENITPGPVSALVAHRARLWALDSTTGQWWFSKRVTPGSPIEFSDVFTFAVDQSQGGITAGASLDDKFISFRPASIGYIVGQGPADNGINDDFSDEIPIPSDVGCSNPRSVVTTPLGVMFQSQKGIYLLNRGLGLEYIGAEVEAFNGQTVIAAVQMPGSTQVRFTLQGGPVLVYDYLVKQWSVFTASILTPVDACLFQNVYAFITTAGAIYQETPGLFSDAGHWITTKIETSWLKFAGLQGFQRVRRAQLLGTWAGNHQLYVEVWHDFEAVAAQALTLTPDLLPFTPPLQWRLDLVRQKSEAVKLVIADLQYDTIGDSLSLSGLAFEVGLKKGARKVPASRQVG